MYVYIYIYIYIYIRVCVCVCVYRCSAEDQRRLINALGDVQALKEACRLEFVSARTTHSTSQQQVSNTLRRIGLSVEDEVRCPKSGYSIDMVVTDSALAVGGERSGGGGVKVGCRV